MTARCSWDGKVSYKTKKAAERALRTVQLNHSTEQHAYRCPDRPSVWHLGHSSDVPPPTSELGVGPQRWSPLQWDVATMMLWSRCRDACEWAKCGRPLGNEMVRHHRQRRAIGGDRLGNLVALHDACHKQVHLEPAESMRLGIIVSSYAPDPLRVPLEMRGGRLVLLDDEGAYLTAP